MSAVIQKAIQLIQCESLTPSDAGAHDFLESWLKDADFTIQALNYDHPEKPHKSVKNMLASHGSGAPHFVFLGHSDVVATGPETDWSFPPFAAEIHSGWLQGRGSSDMKGALAAQVEALRQFVQQNPNHPGTVSFLVTSDEEGPAQFGAKYALEQIQAKNIQFDYCIVGEPTARQNTADTIKIGRRGSLHGEIHVVGKQGHVGYPHLAKNAAHLMGNIISMLAEIELDQGNDAFDPSTLQITKLESGLSHNIIPGTGMIRFNIRFNNEQSADGLKARIEKELADFQENIDCIDWHLSGEPFLCARGRLLEAATHAIENAVGQKPHYSTSGGTSDGRFMAKYCQEVIELGSINHKIHQIDEAVPVADLEKLTQIYQNILSELLLEPKS